MKRIILIACAALPLVGCATHQGGTVDTTDTMSGSEQGSPTPAASPSFRSGINPQDPRDSHFNPPSQDRYIP